MKSARLVFAVVPLALAFLASPASATSVRGEAPVASSVLYDHAEPVGLPDVLRDSRGRPVGTVAEWEDRRKELLRFFERNVYGERPVERPADLSFTPVEPDVDFPLMGAVRKHDLDYYDWNRYMDFADRHLRAARP